jgi:ribosomal protein S18 acetylase RimI-like enzyme
MNHWLDNPVFHALRSGDQQLSFGNERVKYFDPNVSPFASFEEGNRYGFEELHQLLPPGRFILYATPHRIHQPEGWQLLDTVAGLQFIFDTLTPITAYSARLVALQEEHIEAMVQLATLTKPGPFGTGTIRFGHYYGIFDKGQLVAMTGQRLHVQNFTEISAVCTHPEHLGKGYATALVAHQLQLIREQGQIPFLHVREDNTRAIDMYKRLGFTLRGPMNFYPLKRK